MKHFKLFLLLFALTQLSVSPCLCQSNQSNNGHYISAVRQFADTLIQHGRDTYGEKQTPLFVDGLHVETLKPVVWKKDGESWILCNFASQQPLMRLLDSLTILTGDKEYRKAAEDATNYALEHLQSKNGLLYWGGHLAWDLKQDKAVGQYESTHELKNHQPYYSLMWRVNPDATKKLLRAIWATHILDWSRLDYNRHANVKKDKQPQWDHDYNKKIEVPFPAKGNNLSFVNVTPPLMHSGTMLAILDKNTDALRWTRRLVHRWQQGEHPETGLCGGQLSYREHDRAQDALGHVHPTINEAKIVASYHQTSRYHYLPLAQMQAGEKLSAAGGKYSRVGKKFIQWALQDLKTYAKHCFDSDKGHFIAMMIDGTPLKWQEAKTGYYVPASFAPRKPDGFLFWGYAMAYRLSQDQAHWQIAREIGKILGIGDIGNHEGHNIKLNLNTVCTDWRMIYGLLDLYKATNNKAILQSAECIADNILKTQTKTGLFPRGNYKYARTGDEIPLALIHLAASIEGKSSLLPSPFFDYRFFHCEYHGELEDYQQKRADKRTYDHLVFYGS